jgi:uncharacterized protein (TIGR02594 family)
MTKTIHAHFFGRGDHRIIGIVEERNDPLQMGRVKVRIHGHHTFDKQLIPTADLPWAFPVMPITHGGVSGVGNTVNLMIGAVVVGYWADWPDCQVPFVDGVINQIELAHAQQSGGGGSYDNPSHLNQDGNKVNDVLPGGSGSGTIQPGTGSGPDWLQLAQKELAKGVKAWPGASHNPEVLKYGKAFGFTTDDSEHPWCSAFVHWCLKNSGHSVSGINGLARSHLRAGCYKTIQEPQLGCVAVFARGSSGVSGHVAFWLSRSSGRDKILGGNQGNSVSISSMSTQVLLGYRMPQ